MHVASRWHRHTWTLHNHSRGRAMTCVVVSWPLCPTTCNSASFVEDPARLLGSLRCIDVCEILCMFVDGSTHTFKRLHAQPLSVLTTFKRLLCEHPHEVKTPPCDALGLSEKNAKRSTEKQARQNSNHSTSDQFIRTALSARKHRAVQE